MTTKETIELRRTALWTLQEERKNLERELAMQKQTLEAVKKERGARTAVAPGVTAAQPKNAIDAVTRYARKKGVLAARAIRDGKGDAGHVRDLADAAIFGSGTAATTLAEITLAAKAGDGDKQVIEAHAWLTLATMLEPGNAALGTRLGDLAGRMSEPARAASKQLLGGMEERRATLLTNPYD